MGATVRYVTPELVRAFRLRHLGPAGTQSDLAEDFGVQARAVRHWEGEGAPLYVGLMMAYAEKYGYRLLAELGRKAVKGQLPAFDRDAMKIFLTSHDITQTKFTKLLGFTSEKASTNWKIAGDAPNHVKILVAAIERCGIDLLVAMNGGVEIAGMKSLIEAKDMKTVVDSFDLPDVSVVADVPAPVALDARIETLDNPAVAKALRFLSARDRDIVISRKFSAEPQSLGELGDKYGITRQRVQQIESVTMKKLASALV
ncbi:RNA polymerase sigma factor [Sphingobium phage Lacusarx]|uniref:RNA polymerase sigma factor n=1 Tax=Sphingobium phage Lacusarx TaxID=1980139 RepID=A0A1W6DXB0_9CAUD|nr:RNA polymerase sigma factor [Sphingobium phage Lacusarx]ARK07496.1 RNA polymerase sigma factor [Sphingobium phage Lacusarx]